MSKALSQGWIFGPKKDSIVFIGASVAALILGLITQSFNFWPPPLVTAVFFDGIHLYLIFLHGYTSQRQWRERSSQLIFIPIFFWIAFGSLVIFFGETIACYFVAAFAVQHFIKQQAAWFLISVKNTGFKNGASSFINQAAIYASTLGILLISLASQKPKGWFEDGDLGSLPISFYDPLVKIVCLCICVYVAYHFYVYLKLKMVFLAQHIMLFNALLIWGLARLSGPNLTFGVWMMAFGHCVPYFYLTGRYLVARKSVGESFYFPLLSTKALVGVVFFGALVMALIDFHLTLSDFNLTLWAVISLSHYSLDAIFWRKSSHPEVAQVLTPSN